MACFPSSGTYGQARSAGNTKYITINGRRIPVQNGMYGREIEQMACGSRADRRTVMNKNGAVKTLNPDTFYRPEDMMDKYGKPASFLTMPNRTKGGEVAPADRILVFLDFANIEAGGKKYGSINFENLLAYLSEGRFLIEAFAYVPIDPRRPEARNVLIRHLKRSGWMVSEKEGKIRGASYKSNVDIEMCIDIMRSAQQIKPDILVLCSGDGDFIPLVRELRRMGIRTEVASFEDSIDADLPYEASSFISLDVWQDEWSLEAFAQDEYSKDEYSKEEEMLPIPEEARQEPRVPLRAKKTDLFEEDSCEHRVVDDSPEVLSSPLSSESAMHPVTDRIPSPSLLPPQP